LLDIISFLPGQADSSGNRGVGVEKELNQRMGEAPPN
jgi:hypothetical protein